MTCSMARVQTGQNPSGSLDFILQSCTGLKIPFDEYPPPSKAPTLSLNFGILGVGIGVFLLTKSAHFALKLTKVVILASQGSIL